MGREFHGHTTRKLGLKGRSVLFEFLHYDFSFLGPKHADKNMRTLQIRCDVDVVDGDERAFKTDLARKNSTQFPFYDFVDPQHAMFHEALSFPLEFLGHGFELIALDDVAHLVFAEIAELDATFQPGTDFFHVVLKTAER